MSKKFAIDLSKFKKVKSDDKSTTLKHSDGHEMRIAHHAIGPEMRSKLKALPHYSEGGEVSKLAQVKQSFQRASGEKPSTPQPKQVSGSDNGDRMHAEAVARYKAAHPELAESNYAQGGEVGHPCKNPNCPSHGSPHPNCQCYAQGGHVSPCNDPKCFAHGGKVPGRANYADPDGVVTPDDVIPPTQAPAPEQSGLDKLVAGFQKYGNKLIGLPDSSATAPTPSAPNPQQAPSDSPQSTMSATPPVPAQQPPQSMTQPPMSAQGMDAYKKASKEEIQGINNQATATKTQGEAENAAIDTTLGQAKALAQHNKDVLGEIEKTHTKFEEDLAKPENAINAQRYMGKMDVGQKMLTGIGLLLSGMGSGMTHTTNMAAQYLDNQISRDIDAQKAELGKRETLLSANMKHYGNAIDGAAMTRVDMNNVLAMNIQKAAATAKGPQAQAVAMQEIAKIKQQNAILTQQVAQNQTMGQLVQEANTNPHNIPQILNVLDQIDPKRAEEMRGRAVPGMGLANTPKDAEELKKMSATVGAATQGINRLLQISKTPGHATSMALRNEVPVIRQTLIGLLRETILGPGMINDSERKMIEGLISDPSAILSLDSSTQKRLETLSQRVGVSLQTAAKARGIGRPTSNTQIPAYKPR